MQACGDVMIGHRWRSVHEAIPHICGAKAIPTSLLVFYHHLELNSQSIKPTVERLSYIFHDSSISRDPHLSTGSKVRLRDGMSSGHDGVRVDVYSNMTVSKPHVISAPDLSIASLALSPAHHQQHESSFLSMLFQRPFGVSLLETREM